MPDWKRIRGEFETTAATLQELADKMVSAPGQYVPERIGKNGLRVMVHQATVQQVTTQRATP